MTDSLIWSSGFFVIVKYKWFGYWLNYSLCSSYDRVKRKKFNFDPIDYASIDKTEFWVVEDEEPPFLDHEEIENALYEEGAYPIEEGSSSHVQRG